MTCRQHRNFGIRHNPEAPLEGMDDPWREPPHQQPKWWWWIIVGFFCLLALYLLFRSVDANAHMHDRPDLDQWLMSLGSARSPCCDNKEAETLADPDWRVDRLDECKPSERASIDTDATFQAEYCVRLENPQAQEKGDWNWWTVPGSAVVHEPNRAGPALIWLYWNAGHPYIRCFMPGAGA